MAYYDTTWYCNFGNGSSTGYYAVTPWAATTAVVAGALRRQLTAPAVNSERVFVCIVAGTTGSTEPTWVLTRGAKTTDGTVTWMECTGIAALNGDITNTINWAAAKATNVPSLGTVIQRNNGASYQICTTAGTLGASEPSFSDTAGVTTTETSATTVWTSLGPVTNFTGGQAPHARLVAVCATNWFAAGNTIYVGDNHAESQTTTININPATSGSFNNIIGRIICHDHLGPYPPGSGNLKNTATVSTTANGNPAINIFSTNAGPFYMYGLTFKAGVGSVAGASHISLGASGVGPNNYYFDNCSFWIANTASGNLWLTNFSVGGPGASFVFNNTTLKFAGTTQMIISYTDVFIWQNTAPALVAGSTVPNPLISVQANTSTVTLEALDLSACSSQLFSSVAAGSFGSMLIKDCKLNASATVTAPLNSGMTVQLVRCDSGATAYKSARYQYEGAETTETSITRVGGASDPTGQAQSRKIVNSANSQWLMPFKAEPYAIWNPVTGANVTVTIYGTVNAGALPNNDDIWMDVEYLSSAPTYTYTTWNPADLANITLSGANLVATATNNSAGGVRGPLSFSAGKLYWEYTGTAFFGGFAVSVGVANASATFSSMATTYVNAAILNAGAGGNLYVNNTTAVAGLGTPAQTGSVIGVALDLVNQNIWFRIAPSGNWNGSGTANPATNTGGISISSIFNSSSLPLYPVMAVQAGLANAAVTANFGASAFTGAVPSGFTAGLLASSSPGVIGTIVNTTKANLLAANAAVASDSSTWNGTTTPATAWDLTTIASVTLSGSNLVATNTGTTSTNQGAQVPVTSGRSSGSGKYYFEVTLTTLAGGHNTLGIATTVSTYTSLSGISTQFGLIIFTDNGNIWTNAGGNTGLSIGARASGDVIGIAVDLINSKIWFRVSPSGLWDGNATYDPTNPVTGGGFPIPAGSYVPFITFGNAYIGSGGVAGNVFTANFGASSFVGAVPTGYTSGWPAVSLAWSPFKLVATLSAPQPGQAGLIYVRPNIAKPSATFYLDPNPVLS